METVKEDRKHAALSKMNARVLESVMKDCTSAISHDQGADLTPVLEQHLNAYRRKLASRLKQTNGSRSTGADVFQVAVQAVRRSPQPAQITYALDPRVQHALSLHKPKQDLENIADGDCPELVRQVEAAIKAGQSLHRTKKDAVVKISHQVVVKKNQGNSTESMALHHILQHTTAIPVPELLGEVCYADTIYTFLSLVEGVSLDKTWDDLSASEKAAVRDQLDKIFEHLRALPLPTDHLGCGEPPLCTEYRFVSRRSSRDVITDERQFNSFLLSDLRMRVSKTYLDFLRTKCLREDHRIVMTHGDLAPRNIIVREGPGPPDILAIVDWECAGAYPEYWEYVKALHTVGLKEENDWYEYLPEAAIGQHGAARAIDMLISRIAG